MVCFGLLEDDKAVINRNGLIISSYPAVTDKDILEIEVPVPPISEQDKFSNLIHKVERIKEKQRESKKELDSLFNSLMQKAFS